MAELSRFFGIVIAVYFRGEIGRHNLPHIHVYTEGCDSVFSIKDGKKLAGEIPSSARRMVKKFIELRRPELMDAWNSAIHGITPRKIKPLVVR